MSIRVMVTRDHGLYKDKKDVKPWILHELDEHALEPPNLIRAPWHFQAKTTILNFCVVLLFYMTFLEIIFCLF